jgi:tellurite resistance protein TerC
MEIALWIGFILLILGLLALDLGVFHQKSHAVSAKEALFWTFVWISLSLAFNGFLYYAYLHHWFGLGVTIGEKVPANEAALEFLTGYLVEKSLSVDNIFVIAMIFSYFGVPQKYQHEILFWGILGALILRGIMIIVGAALIHQFSWVIYVFGVLLLFSAYKMYTSGDEEIEPDKNPAIKLVRKFFPVSNSMEEDKFFTRIDGKLAVTPLFVVLVVVETTDIMFAVDSIPAIFAVTTDAFIVFTSNVFAILGLRSLYFILASVLDKFKYLKTSLVFILAFVAVKMLISHFYKINSFVSLGVIVLALASGVIASLIIKPKEEPINEVPQKVDN